MATEIRVPTLGESVTEATVATWFKKPGDTVAVDEMLCELETDKVTVEVPSPSAGTLGEIVAAEGTTVGVDALLATLTEGSRGSACTGKGGSFGPRSGVWRRRAIGGCNGPNPWRKCDRGDRVELVQEGRGQRHPGRDAV